MTTKTNRAVLLISLLCLTGAYFVPQGAPQALTTAQTVVLAGQALAGSDTLGNATVTVTLTESKCFTSTDVMPPCSKTVTAATNGNWTVTIVGTDSINCVGGGSSNHPTYSVRIEHPVLAKSGQVIEYTGLSIPATNGATTTLRSILAAQ